jgi:hypothetical protein
MSVLSSTIRINMRPAMEELCALEDSCPISNASSSQSSHQLAHYSAQRYSAASSSSASSAPSEALAFRSLTPNDYPILVEQLKKILKNKLAPLEYMNKLVRPFLKNLEFNGTNWFAIELSNKDRPIERIAHAILQNFDPTIGAALNGTTKALREVISDMYQVFLQKKCQMETTTPCLKTPSPLPNWYREDLSTYSHPREDLGAYVSIVNVPSRYATKAAIMWGCLGHEVAGHDILGAYPGALDEIKELLKEAFETAGLGDTEPYWNRWLEEAAADVLGILNIGPAGALSQIAFLRTLSGKDRFKLSPVGQPNDPHPVDLVRGYLAAFTVENMSSEEKPFDKAAEYAELIRAEVDTDAAGVKNLELDTLVLGQEDDLEENLLEFCTAQKLTLPKRHSKKDRTEQLSDWVANKCEDNDFEKKLINFLESKEIPQTRRNAIKAKDMDEMQTLANHETLEDFITSAEIVAKTIMHEKLEALGGRSFHEIKSWTNQDEKICAVFRKLIRLEADEDPVKTYNEGFFASHVVAAAVLESVLETGKKKLTPTRIQKVFSRMITILQNMHRSNPEWQLSTAAQIAPSYSLASSEYRREDHNAHFGAGNRSASAASSIARQKTNRSYSWQD